MIFDYLYLLLPLHSYVILLVIVDSDTKLLCVRQRCWDSSFSAVRQRFQVSCFDRAIYRPIDWDPSDGLEVDTNQALFSTKEPIDNPH